MAFSTRKTGGWKTRALLQRLEGKNIRKAQELALRLRRLDPSLPKKMSLVGLYEGAQSRFTQGVEALANAKQDEVARLVLGIIKPPPPEIETIEHYQEKFLDIEIEFISGIGKENLTININGVSLFVDKHSKDGSPTQYTIGTAFHLAESRELARLTKKSILVGRRFGDPLEIDALENRLAKLKKRLADPLVERTQKRGQLAIVDIREHPAEEDLEQLFIATIEQAPDIITQILTAAIRGTTTSDGQILEVTL